MSYPRSPTGIARLLPVILAALLFSVAVWAQDSQATGSTKPAEPPGTSTNDAQGAQGASGAAAATAGPATAAPGSAQTAGQPSQTTEQRRTWDAGDQPPGFQATSNLTIQNECKHTHSFAVTDNTDFITLQFSQPVKVAGHSSATESVLFHTDGLAEGDHSGEITVTCLDCEETPPCMQDQKSLWPHIRIVAPPATNTTAAPQTPPTAAQQAVDAARAAAPAAFAAAAAAQQAATDAANAAAEPDEKELGSSEGKTISTRDLQLKRAASRQAWQDYISGKITAEELEERWRNLDEYSALEKLRAADRAARAKLNETAQAAADRAAAAIRAATVVATEASADEGKGGGGNGGGAGPGGGPGGGPGAGPGGGPGGGTGGPGGGVSVATPPENPPLVIHFGMTTQEPPCQYAPVDGYFEPTQGVWQDDTSFVDKPGKQLVRTGDITYHAELPMVAGRDTVLYGVHHYVKGSGGVLVKDRENIALSYKTNCTNSVVVHFKFTVTGTSQAPIVFYGNQMTIALLEGPPTPDTRTYTVKQFAYLGVPDDTTFKFQNPGPYSITAELVKLDDSPTGISMSLSGEVIRTHGPVVSFVPVELREGVDDDALRQSADTLATDAQKYIPDFYPLQPGDLPTKLLSLRDFSSEGIPDKWFEYRRQEALLAKLEDTLTAGTFLNGAGRVMVVVDQKDFDAVAGLTTAAFTTGADFHLAKAGVVLNWKLSIIPKSAPLQIVAHELIHTLPPGWSSAGMLAECGRDYHNQDTSWANGIRLVGGGLPMRREKNGSLPVMGPLLTNAQQEAMNAPLGPDSSSLISVKNPSTGAMEEGYIVQQWITQCSYWHLTSQLLKPPDPSVILVRGFVGRQYGKTQGEFHSFYDLMGDADVEAGAGAWSIVLRDGAGKALGTYPFTPRWEDFEGLIHRNMVAFDFRVPSLPGAVRADLMGPQGLLDTRKFSAQAPQISIESPAQDSQLPAGSSRTGVNWTATGEPGRKLLYTVLYSPGDDRAYGEQSFEQSGTSFDLRLAPGVKAHFVKVIVSDGTRSAESAVKFTTP